MNGSDETGYVNGAGDSSERVAILDAGAQYGKVLYMLVSLVKILWEIL